MTAAERAEHFEARAELRRILRPGSTACTILRHVSRSGMARDISIIVNDDGGDGFGEPRDITYLVACVLRERLRDSHGHYAIRMTGAGMDMGFALIYNLSHALWQPDLDTIPPKHTNDGSDAGYAIQQRWI